MIRGMTNVMIYGIMFIILSCTIYKVSDGIVPSIYRILFCSDIIILGLTIIYSEWRIF